MAITCLLSDQGYLALTTTTTTSAWPAQDDIMSQSLAIASSSRDVIDGQTGVASDDLVRAISAARDGHQSRLTVQEDNPLATKGDTDGDGDGEEESESCLICLGDIIDRSVLPKCLHSLFCFDCITRWISIHRRCPLCSTSIERYIIHSIRSDSDYIRHYLPILLSTDEKESNDDNVDPLRLQADLSQEEARRVRRQFQQRITRDRSSVPLRSRASSTRTSVGWGEAQIEERQRNAIANWDQRLAFRRKVYREQLYCLHIGTNSSSKMRPPSSHSVIASSSLIESSLLSFIRRELLAYPLTIDFDFLSRYTIHVLKTFDCKSSEAIDLMAEFLGMRGAEHFCHEVYSFNRFLGEGGVQSASGKQRDKVKAFDEWAQYEPQVKRRHVDRKRSHLQGEDALSEVPVESSVSIQGEKSPAIRQEMIKAREKLLQRLEQEKKVMLASASFVDAADRSSLLIEEQTLERERSLKEKLLLHKQRASLKKTD